MTDENWGDMEFMLDPNFDIDNMDIYPEDFELFPNIGGINSAHSNPYYVTTNHTNNNEDPQDTVRVRIPSWGINIPSPPQRQSNSLFPNSSQEHESPGQGSSARTAARRTSSTNTAKTPVIIPYKFRTIESLERELEQAKVSGKTGNELRPYEKRIAETKTYQKGVSAKRLEGRRKRAMNNVINTKNSPKETYSDPEEQRKAMNRRSQRRVSARIAQEGDDHATQRIAEKHKRYRDLLKVVRKDMGLSSLEVLALPQEERQAAMAKVRANGLAPPAKQNRGVPCRASGATRVARRLGVSQRQHHTRASGNSATPTPDVMRASSASQPVDLTLVELYNRNQARPQGHAEQGPVGAGRSKVPLQNATPNIDPELLQMDERSRARPQGSANLHRGQLSTIKVKGAARPLQDFAATPAHARSPIHATSPAHTKSPTDATSPAYPADPSPCSPNPVLLSAGGWGSRDRSRSRTLRAESYDNRQDFSLCNSPSPVLPTGNPQASSSPPSSKLREPILKSRGTTSRSRETTPRSRETTPRSKSTTPRSKDATQSRESTPGSQSSGAGSSWRGFSSSPSPPAAPTRINQAKTKGVKRPQQITTSRRAKEIPSGSSQSGLANSRAALNPKAIKRIPSHSARGQDKVRKAGTPMTERRSQKPTSQPRGKDLKNTTKANNAAIKAAKKAQEEIRKEWEKAQKRTKDAEMKKEKEKEKRRKEQKKIQDAQKRKEAKGLKKIRDDRAKKAKVARKAAKPKKAAHTARHSGVPKRRCIIL